MLNALVILVPVLGRPHRVRPLLASIEASAPQARVLFLADPDDAAEIRAIRHEQAIRPLRVDLDTGGGNYAEKINRGVALSDEPLLFMGADDLDFQSGWLEAASAALSDAIGVVGINDLIERERVHATHFLIARSYAERGTIDEIDKLLHEGYAHNFVDDEFLATAKHREAYAYVPEARVRHLHPMAGAGDDETYRKGRASFRADRRLFHRQRAPLWR